MRAGCAPRVSVPNAAAAPCRREGACDVRRRAPRPARRARVLPPRRNDHDSCRRREVSVDELRVQSLEACGWRELCEHLAEYASTRLGPEACLNASLPTATVAPGKASCFWTRPRLALADGVARTASPISAGVRRRGPPRAVQGGEVRVPRRGRARGDDGVHRRGDALSENGGGRQGERARRAPELQPRAAASRSTRCDDDAEVAGEDPRVL